MPRRKKVPRGYLDLAACAELARVPDQIPPNVARIAWKLGCHPRSLIADRCPTFNRELGRRRAKWSGQPLNEEDEANRIAGRRCGRTPGFSDPDYDDD